MFIVIDGPDGTGKTTISKALVKKLVKLGKDAVWTAEPTHSPLGIKIREALRTETNPEVLLKMFLEDRRQHCNEFIIPAMAANKAVVCDRYKLSSVCYQQNDKYSMETLLKMQTKFIDPDYTFILYFKNANTIEKRITERRKTQDAFETYLFQKKMNEDFIKLAQELKKRQNIHLVKAEQNPNQIIKHILEVINV